VCYETIVAIAVANCSINASIMNALFEFGAARAYAARRTSQARLVRGVEGGCTVLASGLMRLGGPR